MLKWTKVLTLAFGVALTSAGLIFSCQRMYADEGAGVGADGDRTIKIVEPWARATPGGVTIGAAYLTILPVTTEGDRLVAVSSPKAGRVEIHSHAMDGGVMKMRKIPGLDISAKDGPRVLAPGGDHIMLFDLKAPLVAGDKLPLTLKFDRAGQVQVSAKVLAIGAQGPAVSPGGASVDHSDDMHRGSGSGEHD